MSRLVLRARERAPQKAALRASLGDNSAAKARAAPSPGVTSSLYRCALGRLVRNLQRRVPVVDDPRCVGAEVPIARSRRGCCGDVVAAHERYAVAGFLGCRNRAFGTRHLERVTGLRRHRRFAEFDQTRRLKALPARRSETRLGRVHGAERSDGAVLVLRPLFLCGCCVPGRR
jgi:hypothetical protein